MPEIRKKPLLFQKYPKLEGNVPWIKLIPSQTPVRKLSKLETKFCINSLWVKCDDLTSPLYGGNKSRKMEFIYAEALNQNCRKVLTAGAIGSNQCVANAIFCEQLKLKPIAVMIDQPVTSYVRDNLLLDVYFKNEIFYEKETIPKSDDIYYMPPGGSNPIGTLGYVEAALELKNQVDNGEIPEPDYIFVPTASSGTAAGLTLGVKLAGLKTQIHAVQASFSSLSNFKAIRRLANKTKLYMAKYDNTIPDITFEHLHYTEEYYGGEYGLPTPEALKAIKIAQEENISLEPTYSGKTFAALLDFILNNKKEIKDKTVVFWNTYNSRDFSNIIKKVDYYELPKELHWVFEEPLPKYG
ncbi:MAG: pyridoxal-phosphate dependent enzyme [Promethearchaeota archaeon]|nr:MAG: pyridoxal-phosphate dependent enzyme [Candidatus Lokiarchaeota archaeon]